MADDGGDALGGGGDGGAGGGEGDIGVEWKDALPDGLKNDPTIANTKSVESMASQLVNAQKLVGNSLRLPADDAPAGEWSSFYAKLGRPDDATGYTHKPGEDIGEEFHIDKGRQTEMFQMMHNMGLTDKQTTVMMDMLIDGNVKEHERFVTTSQKALDELRGEWGGQYDTNIQIANRALNSFGGEALRGLLANAGLQNNAEVIKLFNRIGQAMGEDKLVAGDVLTGPLLAEEIDAKIKEVEAKLMKMTSDNSEYKSLLAEKERLYEQRYGTKVAATVG
jgi:hypothetical protein|tara:strand:- start:1347 stop:2180 length:834 start_codon:yes stop_codon:yes gene_type:complete